MVSSSFLPGRGGIESYLGRLCEELAPHLAVLAPAKRDGVSIPTGLSYPATGYPGSMLVPTRRVARAIAHEAAARETDRVLFGTPWPLVLLGPQLKKAGLSYSVIVHGAEVLIPASVPGLNRRLATCLAEADLLLTVSAYTAEKLAALLRNKGHEAPPIEVLRARVDLERFTPERSSAELRRRLCLGKEQPMVLCFGRLVRRKGIDRLITSFDAIAARVSGAALVIAGTGPELRKLKRMAEKVRAPVILAGRVPEDDAPSFYATADVFALPVVDRWFGLDVEGLGVVLLEAAACGTPTVTGTSGGTPEAVVHGSTGFVVDATDVDSLIDKVAALLADTDQAKAMGRAGRTFVSGTFTGRPLPRPLLHWLDLEGNEPEV